jgi:hypothetical protein
MLRLKKAKAAPSKRNGAALAPLIAEVRGLIQSSRHAAATAVNSFQVLTNFEIDRRIVEHEQKGQKRAGYGQELLKLLGAQLTAEFGAGFSKANLVYMRRFYLEWRHRDTRIAQTVSGQLAKMEISRTPSGQFAAVQISATPSRKSVNPFSLSWSHYVLLLSIKDSDERSFYEIEASSENWSLRELKRQVASSLYERLAPQPQ